MSPFDAAGVLILLATASDPAQEPTASSRAGLIAQQQTEKAQRLLPPVETKAQRILNEIERRFILGEIHWHPYFVSAYAGGGFTLGAGWGTHVSPYNTIDFRGSITLSGYKRIEAEFIAPRLLKRRGRLSLLGGWREATDVGFYGIGTANTSADDRANYSFRQPYGTASLSVDAARYLVLGGAVEYSQWDLGGGKSDPSIERIHTLETLPGLEATTNYFHPSATLAFDSRPAAGYAKSGGYYGVTFHGYVDPDDVYGFRQVDYEAVQHLPILHDAWVLSLRGRVETTHTDGGQTVPFFMMPSLGGGSSLRGFASWRFRDRHSLLLSAEWRILLNHFLDMAVFYDTGKVVARTEDLDLNGLKDNYGIGFRFHGPLATPLRIELAKSNEGLAIVFSSKAAF